MYAGWEKIVVRVVKEGREREERRREEVKGDGVEVVEVAMRT